MFADIYPLTRLPRRFGAFTYAIPDTMSPSEMIRGMLVVIPWRSGSVRGIVSNTHTRQPKTETKTVLEMLPQRLSDLELGVYERVAEETFQSVSSILDAAFPTPRKRASLNAPLLSPNSRNSSQTTLTTSPHIPVSELDRLERIAMNPPLRTFVQTGDLIETALLVRFLAKYRPDPILFLLPHRHDLHIAAELLATWKLAPTLCTNGLTEPQRDDLSQAWRRGNMKLLLSTRLGSLFPPPQNLSAIVVGRSGVDEHAQEDRNPRYDARRLAESWSKIRGCSLILCDTLPRCVDIVNQEPREEANQEHPAVGRDCRQIFRAPSMKISAAIAAKDPDRTSLEIFSFVEPWGSEIVDTGVSVRYGEDPLLSENLSFHIGKTLEDGNRALLICNQKGLGARMECRDCTFIEICASCQKPLAVYETHLSCVTCKRVTARPKRCRKCKSNKLKTVRRGTKSLEKLLKERWPDTSVEIIEKGGHAPSHDASLLIATSYYYEALYRPHADRFGLVALPCADQEVRLGADLSCVARRLIEYQGIAKRNRCPFLLQTWDPKLIGRLIQESDTILREECQAKRELGQAPFTTELELLGRAKEGLKELDRAILLARTAPKTTLIQRTPARWKILTNDAKLLQKLRETDDSLVVANKTWL